VYPYSDSSLAGLEATVDKNILPLGNVSSPIPMILHASKAFTEHLKCEVSGPKRRLPHHSSLESWSIDLVQLPKVGTYALVMNDASLSTIIIPLKGIRKFEVFLPMMLERVAELFVKHGLPFDSSNQTVMILPRSNKSLIGTMNDAKSIIRDSCSYDLRYVGVINWPDLEKELNETPYSRIDMDSPDERLRKLIASR